jgi:hypothetical protein
MTSFGEALGDALLLSFRDYAARAVVRAALRRAARHPPPADRRRR